ncbi:MAG: insulinase family protein [bacterium]
MIAAPDPFIVVTDESTPLVHLHLWFPVGPPLDPAGMEGLTALTIRSLIRGTRRRSRAEVEEEVEGLGSELVTMTQRQAIGIGGTLLSRHLERFIAILTEVVTEPAFTDAEIHKTLREMYAELETLVDDDSALARRWFRRSLFEGTPYAHGTNGWKESLARITPDDVRAWHGQWLTRASLVVGASGPLDQGGVKTALAPLLAALPAGRPRTGGCRRRPPPRPASGWWTRPTAARRRS